MAARALRLRYRGNVSPSDVGLPLDAPDEGHESLLPQVPGFRDPDDSLLGVVISHPHLDHYGLARHIRSEVPVYIGEDAHNILKAASAYLRNGHAFNKPRFIKHREHLEIGPFRITSYLADHSAFDAYSLLIEADGNETSTRVIFAHMDARRSYSNRWSSTRRKTLMSL